MPQPAILRVDGRLVTYSFTSGVLYQPKPDWVIRNDTDALAYALYLERRGRKVEAMEFLNRYLRE
ncbi:hypothetical protein KC887_06990 [Candidatus Kaiserbacteria bacterium]|nr:hypothetical protein [Candidatus Kaiserbacteria bacterium]